ncbi:MAG: hypothetical protein CVU12_00710, partial [Bacteroidetes bacterium HGW-Bacteroidetes-7]
MDQLRLWIDDPWLEPFSRTILERYQKVIVRGLEIAGYGKTLSSAVNSHLYYGVHSHGKGT